MAKQLTAVRPLLEESYALYRAHLKTLAGYLAWPLIPLVGVFLISMFYKGGEELAGLAILILVLVNIALWIWVAVIVLSYIDGILSKKKPNFTKLQKSAWGLVATVAIVAILQTLIILGGFILLIIPGIIFLVWFGFAQYAVILDGKKPIEALSYSKGLVEKRFWPVIWRLLGGPAIFYLLYSIGLGILIYLLSFLFPGGIDALMNPEIYTDENFPLWIAILETLAETFIAAPYLMIYGTLLYRDLKK